MFIISYTVIFLCLYICEMFHVLLSCDSLRIYGMYICMYVCMYVCKKLLRYSRTVLHVVICLLNNYFEVLSMAVFCCLGCNIEQLNCVDAWKGHRSFMFMLCYWTDTYSGHCPSSCFTITYFGNSLQNMFYGQCPLFSICVSYTAVLIFDLNFSSHLWSLTANQECRMCGVEKDNWNTTMKTIYKKKIRWEIVCSNRRYNFGTVCRDRRYNCSNCMQWPSL
jgi:hypothetical protein